MQRKMLTGMIAMLLSITLMMPVEAMASASSSASGNAGFENVSATKSRTVAKKVSNGWAQENGRWFYYKKGKVVTGWQKIGNATYYLRENGAKGVKGRMLTGLTVIDQKTFYFGSASDGKLKTGWHKVNGKWFYFRKKGGNGTKGEMLLGWRKIGSKTYYLKKTGKLGAQGAMLSGFRKIGKQTFYFGSSGDGALKTGWQTVGGKKYYLRPTGAMGTRGAMYKNGTYTIGGKKYHFDANGVNVATATAAASTAYPASGFINLKDPTNGKTYKVEPEILTDPQIGKDISLEAFFAAVLYTESGDQGYTGQLMVAMTILNRVEDKGAYWPNSLKFVVYQDQNYAVARRNANGSEGPLTKTLKEIQTQGYTKWQKNKFRAESVKAAKESMKKIANWKKDPKKNPRTINKEITNLIKAANKTHGTKGTEFNHTYFMTPASFTKLNLSPKGCQVFTYRPNTKNSGHVFFREWKKK